MAVSCDPRTFARDASLLIAGDAGRPVFVMNKCAVLALERMVGGWAVCWQIFPELLE